MRQKPIIAVSGGFDPLHVGHTRLITSAKAYGGVVVILNSDEWLERKKGFIFMPWEQRREIIDALHAVHLVVGVNDEDGTVCSALELIRPDYFGNGGDRTSDNTPEAQLCHELGIEMVYNLGGGKIQSSSELVKNIVAEIDIDE